MSVLRTVNYEIIIFKTTFEHCAEAEEVVVLNDICSAESVRHCLPQGVADVEGEGRGRRAEGKGQKKEVSSQWSAVSGRKEQTAQGDYRPTGLDVALFAFPAIFQKIRIFAIRESEIFRLVH